MDALGTAVGVASLGIQICHGLLSYYDGWKGYHTDISSTYESIADLAQTFTILKANLADSETSSKSEGIARVETCLGSCTEYLHRLQGRLSKLRSHGESQGLRQKTWTEIQRAWYPFRASTLEKLKQNVGELRERLSLALQTLQQITLDQGLSRMTDGLSELLITQQATQNKVSEILTHQQTAEGKILDVWSSQQVAKEKAIIDWLSPPDPHYNHNAARKRHEPQTGDWLLQSDKYSQWKTSTNTVLWLTGKAGCGKTVLCSTVVEDMCTPPDNRLAFFYFSFSDIQKQSYAALLASLITQLKGGLAFEKLQQMYDKIYPATLSVEALEDILSTCLQQPGQKTLVLDALDEVPEDDCNNGRPAILDGIGRIMRVAHQTRVCLTSRQLTDIQTTVTSFGARCILVEPGIVNSDIRTYVDIELKRHPRLSRFNVDTKEKIKEVFERKADGMFQWAFCQLEALKCLKTTKPKSVEKALHNIPSTLDTTYERMLLHIDEWEEALTALRWLVFETRPLTLGELAEACLITHEDEEQLVDVDNRGQVEDILEILTGLVLVEDSHVDTGSQVRLAHFSVKEYLLSDRIKEGRAAIFAMEKDQDPPKVAQGCLAYLLFYSQSSTKTLSESDFDTFPLLEYAAETWPKLIPKHRTMQPAYERQLLQSETHRYNWLLIHHPEKPPFRPPFKEMRSSGRDMGPPLYYASLLGIVPFCESLIKQGADVNARGGFYDNALQAASHRGNREVVKLLLDAGANIEARGGVHGNALQATCASYSQNRRDVLRMLLDKVADINPQQDWYANALRSAVLGESAEMVEMLLDAGADVNAPARVSSDVFYNAIALGNNFEEFEMLLYAGADVNDNGSASSNALYDAIAYGKSVKMARFLLDAGADVSVRGGKLGNALQAASQRGHVEMVRLLLDANADVNAQGGEYGTAIHAATYSGQADIVHLLLEYQGDATLRDRHGWTPLMLALIYGHSRVSDVLSLVDESQAATTTARELFPSVLESFSFYRGGTIGQDGLTITKEILRSSPLLVLIRFRADHPMPFSRDTFYFEVTVIDGPDQCEIGVGVCEQHCELPDVPGQFSGSWIYHNGKSMPFYVTGRKEYGPIYGRGDVVGCGGDKAAGTIFFTKNGQFLVQATRGIRARLFAIVEIATIGVRVSVNFGSLSFQYKEAPQ